MKNIPAFDDKLREIIQSAGFEPALPGMNERIMNRIELTGIIKTNQRYKPVISVFGWIVSAILFLGLLIISFLLPGNEEINKFNLAIDTEKIMDSLTHFFSFSHLSVSISSLLLFAFAGLLIWISFDFILNSIFEKTKRSS
jgi:hypothetical protein